MFGGDRRTIEIARPKSVDEAASLLAAGQGARLVGGGVAIALEIRRGEPLRGPLVSLRDVAGLDNIDLSGGILSIGSGVTLRAVASSEVVRSSAPSLAAMSDVVGNTRVRNVATLAGNVAHADHASDPPALLMCLDAYCSIHGASGHRTIPVAQLVTGSHRTSLSAEEIITGIHVPVRPERRVAYWKHVSRSSEDAPCVGVAARAVVADHVVHELGVVIGAASPVPAAPRIATDAAIGRPLDDRVIGEVAEGCAEVVDTIDDLRGSSWYRTEMIRVFVRRALQSLRDTSARKAS